MSASDARLTLLENTLVARATHASTPFDQIIAVSNPGITIPTGLKVLQIWWEMYKTTERSAINQILRLTQEVVVGTNIISSMSNESDARQECYGLKEEVERRFICYMPDLGPTTEIIFPMYDLDASFTQIESEGVFTLSVMWSLTWQVAKGSTL